MGSLSSGRCAVLSWEGGGSDAGFEPFSVEKDEWESMSIQPRIQLVNSNVTVVLLCHVPFVRIIPRDPLIELELQHKQPAIVGEFYTVRAVLRVKEAVPVQDIKYSSSSSIKYTSLFRFYLRHRWLLGLKESTSEAVQGSVLINKDMDFSSNVF